MLQSIKSIYVISKVGSFLPTLFLILSFQSPIFSQNEDNIWMMGYTYFTPENPDPSGDYEGQIIFDFSHIPVEVYRESANYMNFQETMSTMCDGTGNLLFYTNGMSINNSLYQPMEQGDTIAYGGFWEHWNIELDGMSFPDGMAIIQGALSLPLPNQKDKYIVLYQDYSLDVKGVIHCYYTIIDMAQNDGLGKVIEKDMDLIIPNETDEIISGLGKITACRHANGRDWWIIIPFPIKDKYFVYLLDPSGINLSHEEEMEFKIDHKVFGQSCFSPDGTNYAMWGGIYVEIPAYVRLYDFDRCTGELYNERIDTLFSNYNNGVSFSPNGEYLYVCQNFDVFQYEVRNEDFATSRKVVAEWDMWEDEFGTKYFLSNMALGRDNKIYIIPSAAGSGYMHLIQDPDKSGESCNVQQHVFQLPRKWANSHTVPNYPNFRLGPLDGSSCDTLGIDNIPVARFSFEQDSLDYHSIFFTDLSYFEPDSWYWDFGDENNSLEASPEHIYEENGIYEVCLTVSNTNASNTHCRSIDIGGVGVKQTNKKIDVDLFPNPVQDVLLVSFTDFVPQDARIEFYNMAGTKIQSEKLIYGWNSLDVTSLKEGVYIYNVYDNKLFLDSGKLIKIE